MRTTLFIALGGMAVIARRADVWRHALRHPSERPRRTVKCGDARQKRFVCLHPAVIGIILACMSTVQGSDDWSALCRPHPIDLSQARQEFLDRVGDLGDDLNGKNWQVISTKYHRVYYADSIDRTKVAHVIGCLDNLYPFLEKWNPMHPEVPIKTFLVPGQSGRSRCSIASNAMRTGDQGDAIFLTTSLLHEETHLFNFPYLRGEPQSWWAGEFSCIYFQERARLEAMKEDVRKHILKQLPGGPHCRLEQITDSARQRFDEAFSAMFFLHSTYGDQKFREFRAECLRLAKQGGLGTASHGFPSRDFFGMDMQQLDQRWRAFYGWDGVAGPTENKKPDTYTKASAEVAAGIVAELASATYQGRAAGSRGERLASTFLVSRFRELGLIPLGLDGSYLQPFKVAYHDLTGPIGLEIRGRPFVYKADFGVLEGGPKAWAEGKMCFVGFGPDGQTEKPDATRLKGKVLVAISRGKGPTNAAAIRTWAEQAGAAGVLLVDPPSTDDSQVFKRKNPKLRNSAPILRVSSAVGSEIFSGATMRLADVCSQLQQGLCPTVEIAGSCRLAAGAEYMPDADSANMVGVCKAERPTLRSVLLLAHYDGQGRDGEQGYYPSANDNASGVGVLLASATLLAQHKRDLPRDVYVAALGAEEVGLVGARALRSSKIIPWQQLDLVICLDEVGHGLPRQLTIQTTSAGANVYLSFSAYAKQQLWEVRPFVRSMLGSDAGAIQHGGIPTLFFITGEDRQHTVEDDAKNTDSRHMAGLAQLLVEFLLSRTSDSHTASNQPERAEQAHVDVTPNNNQGPASIKVTFSAEKMTAQYVALKLAEQAGLGYDWNGSQRRVGDLAKRWVRDIRLVNVPLGRAIESTLGPLGLSYTIQGNELMLIPAPAQK